jgi:hypothetical protein
VRRAVIVTDGEVGIVGSADRETLGKTVLGVALTSGLERDGDLARLATHVVVLDGLEASGAGRPWVGRRSSSRATLTRRT